MKTLIITSSLFTLAFLVVLGSGPVAQVEQNLLNAAELHLQDIDLELPKEEKTRRQKMNTRLLVDYLQNYFTESFLHETGNRITEEEVNQKIDELLRMTYGVAESPCKEYRKQVQRMSGILPLLRVYEKNPDEAESLYVKKYATALTRQEWNQLKEGFSKAGFEQTRKIIEAPLPTDEQIRSGYRWQARAQVLNQKFLDALGRSGIKFSDWRKKRFSRVQILNRDYFEEETLSSLFESAPIDSMGNFNKKTSSKIKQAADVLVASRSEIHQKATAEKAATTSSPVNTLPEPAPSKTPPSRWLWLGLLFLFLLILIGALVRVTRR